MFGEDFIARAIIGFPILIFSLTIHEFAHAWSAYRFGDTTARDMGRLTLNPLAHLDFMGVIVMVMSGFRFGWAKPVPVNPLNLDNPRVADIWISAAGPLSNIGLAFVAAMLFRIVSASPSGLPEGVFVFLQTAVWINLALAFFNLIPLFPLDGSHILRNLLPPSYDHIMTKLDRIAPMLLLFIIIMGWFWMIIGPLVILIGRFFLGY